MAKRRGHGEGSIYQDKSRPGRWVAELDLGRDGEGKRRRKRRTRGTRREAQRALAEMQAERAAGLALRGPDVTVGFLVDRVIADAKAKGRQPKTIEHYKWTATHIHSAFGTRRARDLTALDIEELLERLAAEENLSRSSLNRVKLTLRQALDEGLRLDWLGRNVAYVARTPQSHKTERKALTPGESGQLIAAAGGIPSLRSGGRGSHVRPTSGRVARPSLGRPRSGCGCAGAGCDRFAGH